MSGRVQCAGIPARKKLFDLGVAAVARYPIAGKTVLITGASSGIGDATARALHARGARVAVAGRRQSVLEALALELGGDRTMALRCDVTDRRSVQAAVETTAERFGGLDVVIANAGAVTDPPTTIAAGDEQEFQRVIDTDLLGVWRTVRASLPQIVARRGYVLLTASIYAYVNGVANAAYAVSKGGVEQLGRALRAELAPHGATAGVLYPGWVDTPLITPAFGGNATATAMLHRAFPGWLRSTIAPERVAEVTVRGIERRSARIIVPRRWAPISLLRGLVNAVTDPVIARDPTLRRLLLQLEAETHQRRAEAEGNGAAKRRPPVRRPARR